MFDLLYEQVRHCFDTDDGSLPGIELNRLSPQGVGEIYAMIRRRSRMASTSPEFWSRTANASFPVDSVPNAAALVATGWAEAFHHTVAGLVSAGVELPVLGVFVFSDSIALDYRMGPEWGPSQVAGLFELLWDCCALDTHAVVEPESPEGPPYPERFMIAWTEFQNRRRTLGE